MSVAPSIALLGDVMLGRLVAERLEAADPSQVWSPEVRELCSSQDAVVLNLECCVSDRGRPTARVPGKPFFFRSPPGGIGALRAVGTGVAGLANNHALDFGPEALLDTLRLLDEEGIAHAGAGATAAAARRGAVIRAGGALLGVLAVADHPHELAAADAEPGIAHADLSEGLPDWVGAEIARLRAEADAVLAFPHWGPNMTVRPAAWQRRRAAELIEAGADAVAGHSAHAFHGIERVAGGLALYDLGGALDDYRIDPELRNDLGLAALWRPGGEPELELVGLHLGHCRTELAAGRDAEWVARRLAAACAELGTGVERTGEGRFALR